MFLTREDGMILGPVCWVLGKIFNWIYMFVGFIGNHMGITYVNLSVCVILFTFVLRGALFPLYFNSEDPEKIWCQHGIRMSDFAYTAAYILWSVQGYPEHTCVCSFNDQEVQRDRGHIEYKD